MSHLSIGEYAGPVVFDLVTSVFKETGISDWSDQQIERAIRTGISRHAVAGLYENDQGRHYRDRQLLAQYRAGSAPGP